MPTFRLVMRSGPSLGKIFMLEKPELFVGRDLNNEVVINDPEVSRRHARLFIQGNNYFIEDLGSTNGTFIAGQRLAGPYLLRVGEVITFGERINVVYETDAVDQDVTMIAPPVQSAHQPDLQYAPPPPMEPPPPPMQPHQAPVYSPPPPPVQRPVQAPPPQMGYAGQVPYQAAPPPPAKRGSKAIIIILILLMLFFCLCVVVGLYFAPKELWCILPVWPEGACP